jgi:cyclase
VINWIKEGIDRGAGEILLTSIDKEGTRQGMDLDLIEVVAAATTVPIIASGGVGSPADLLAGAKCGAVAVADILHYGRATINELKAKAHYAGFSVRSIE